MFDLLNNFLLLCKGYGHLGNTTSKNVRVRVGDPERIIEVLGCVDGEELDVIAGSVFKLVRPKV